jgi:hypothetical protein
MRLWRFDCSTWVEEGRRGRQCCKTGLVRKPRAAAVGAERAAVVAERSCGEDKKAQRMFRGDLVTGIVRMELRMDRSSIGILDHVAGIPLGECVEGYRGESRRDPGCSFAGHMGSSVDRESNHRCSARTGPHWPSKPK